ncbi:hypothetical protein GCM10018954_001290 [Kutzneria kofuensis]
MPTTYIVNSLSACTPVRFTADKVSPPGAAALAFPVHDDTATPTGTAAATAAAPPRNILLLIMKPAPVP